MSSKFLEIYLVDTLETQWQLLCKTVLDLTKLPVDPSVLDQLLNDGLIDQSEYTRIMNMLDPSHNWG